MGKFRILLRLALLLIILGALLIRAYPVYSGPLIITGLALLAFALRLRPDTSSYAFTIAIFMAVAASLYYPNAFRQINGWSTSALIVPILMLIMLGMGTSLNLKDFIGVLRMPKGVLIGVICQFTFMPLIGLGLAYLSKLPPEIAAGIILVGSSPSGLASNVMTYIAKANLALSITLTMVATLLAPLMTPLLMKTYADQLIPIDFMGMFWSICKIVIIPICIGLFINHIRKGRWTWIDWLMPKISMFGIALVITIITAAGRDSLLSIGFILIAVVVVHNILGYFIGYWASRASGLDIPSSKAIAFEVGMQNAGLASGISVEMGKIATMGLAPAVFGPFMNITGSALASYWREPSDEPDVNE